MGLADSLVGGKKTISSSSTAERLSTEATTVTGVFLQASAANAAVIYVGASSVNAEWPELRKGEWIAINIVDPTKVYVFGTSGDSVRWLGAAP